MIIDPAIVLASRVLGTLVFGAAVLGKLRHRDEFVGVVANYRLVPEALVTAVAWLIIVFETAIVLSFTTGLWLTAAAALAVFLLCGFAVAMAINLARGRIEIDCGCFQSALRQRLSLALVVRNLLLIVSLLPLFGSWSRPVSMLQLLDGIAAGVVLFLLYQVFGLVLSLRDAAEALRKRFA